ncbi:hypothetical protein ACU635_15160 [[Actinomadura] parvosata]|uniref:hypothetical protein n=1 Tax=[Actinomadura] parvosata TaxID=1955412 RepID=UPI00406CC528
MSNGRTAQVTMPGSHDEPAGSPETTGEVSGPGEHEQHAEDRLTMPAAWLRALHPRRGGAKVAVPPLDPAAPERLAAKLDALRQQVLDALEKCPDPELVAAGTAYLAGEPTAPPLGAAVVVASLSWSDHELAALFAETWLVERGLVFAATAMTELASLTYEVAQDIWRVQRMASDEYHHYWYGWNRMELAGRVRAVLSAASDAEYAQVVAALAVSREGGLHHRVMASFLAPSETGWVTADCAEVSAVNVYLAHHLVPAISTPEQAALIADHVHGHVAANSTSLATLVDGMGVEVVPMLIGWLGQTYDADGERRLLGTLAELPSDAAMRALLDRLDQKHVQPAFLRAAARFPRRAMRLLAATGGKSADQLLRAHVLTHLDLVEEVVASADTTAAERITGIANAVPVAAAPPEALPEVLVSPPWARKRKTRKPTVVTGLTCADAPVLRWAPGERDNWRSSLEQGTGTAPTTRRGRRSPAASPPTAAGGTTGTTRSPCSSPGPSGWPRRSSGSGGPPTSGAPATGCRR